MNAPDWEDVSVFIREFATDVVIYVPDGDDIILKGIFDDAFFLAEIGEANMDMSMPRLTMTMQDAAHLRVKSLIRVHDTDFYVYEIKPDGTGMAIIKLSKDST